MYRPTDSFTNDRRVCLLSTEMQPESGLSLLDGPFLCVASLSLSRGETRTRSLFTARNEREEVRESGERFIWNNRDNERLKRGLLSIKPARYTNGRLGASYRLETKKESCKFCGCSLRAVSIPKSDFYFHHVTFARLRTSHIPCQISPGTKIQKQQR